VWASRGVGAAQSFRFGENIGVLKFPEFRPNNYERNWVASELQTARIVRTVWTNTPTATRKTADFLAVIARFGWVNQPESDGESTRLWRNRHMAEWLDTDEKDDDGLAQALASLTGLTGARARWIISTPTGITHYYTSLRPGALRAIGRNAARIHKALSAVSATAVDPIAKVGAVASMLEELPPFAGPARRRGSLVNALTPIVACLDPQRRFPIMNDRTEALLRALGKTNDAEGAMALARLIGQHGIRHSFDLDVYAASGKRRFPKAQRRKKVRAQRAVGWKDEEEGYATLSKKRIRVRRLHNALVNRFVRAIEWKFRLLESEFDIVVDEWKRNRKLLVEAKTSTDGPAGRAQLRQAIGQLHDYRWRAFPDNPDVVDLALLVPRKPQPEVVRLLKSVGIETLWFEGKAIRGTVHL
jgi:hypothetical protein